jgi:DNA-binding MarR family transcriptional regulator
MSRTKHELFTSLVDEVRRSQSATARFDRAVADAIGINPTDMRCVDVLSRTGPLTAGQLADETGLSSGAMTTAIDRLEAAGYVSRERDPADRRRVVVTLTAKTRALDSFYSEHAQLGETLYQQHSVAELELLLGFVRSGRELNERRAGELEAQNRETPAK